MPEKTPVTVVTGFLGAGKTTLIRHLLGQSHGKRIALVINEFGDLSVDGEILKGCGDIACAEEDMVELSNGCICCTVAEDFVPTMETLLDRGAPPDHIVIETSGLALPQPLLRAFQWPDLRGRVTLDGVVAVVDGPAVAGGGFVADLDKLEAQRAADDSLDHSTPISELFEDQLASADLIVVSKSDLLGEQTAQSLAARLKGGARAGVHAIAAAHGAVDVQALLGLGLAVEDDLAARAEIHHHHDHDDHDHGDHHHDDHDDHHHDPDHHHHSHDHGHDAFESFVVDLPELSSREAAADGVAAVMAAHPILRLKGYGAVAGKRMRLVVQAVGPRVEAYFDQPLVPEAPRAAQMVVIGQAPLDKAAIAAALAEALAPAEAA